MPHLTEEDVHSYVHGICFKTGPPGLVGVETEWLVIDPDEPREPVPLDLLCDLVAAAGALPAQSTISYEPGGQLELSSLPQCGIASAYAALAADLDHLRPHLDAAGLRLWGTGLDPYRSPKRQLNMPRYAAMETYFDTSGPVGRAMMCSTASIQVCLDIGRDPADAEARWMLAHRLGPVLTAAFANSPTWRGKPTGWRSTRQFIWAAIDPTRTRPAAHSDPIGEWARYALDAPLMAIRRDERPWIVNPGLRFRDWLAGPEYEYGRPTLDDLVYHLSTLFPPVRPRGWLELRMIDAVPEEWWPVPLAVAAALIDDARAADRAREALERLFAAPRAPEELWVIAALDGLEDPALARCARECFTAARDALPRLGGADLVPLVDAYLERFIVRGRCPADDRMPEGGA